MRPRFALGVLAGALVLACGRGGARPRVPPPPAIGPALPGDTIAVAFPDSQRITIPILPVDTSFRPPAERTPAPSRPGERCILDLENNPATRVQFIRDPVSGKYTTYLGGGLVGQCRGQQITIIADSAESYDQNQLHFLIGNVKYRERRVRLDADRITYFQSEERLLAEGNVVAVMEDSSTMTGPRAEYFRAVRGLRVRPRMIATLRPTLTLHERDSTGRRIGEPVTLIADNIVGEGDSLFIAWGTVHLDRSDLLARGDSARLDNAAQYARLMKAPYIESKGEQPFTLRGRVIDLYGRSRAVERVLAMDSAEAVNQDLTLASDTIDLRVLDNKLQRAFAFGPGAAAAISRDRTILADSLDVIMPDQRIRELRAVGEAYAETEPDTLKIRSTERDWLRGDTIVARFDSLAPADTATQPRIRELVSSGNASSYYQVPSSSAEVDRPGINYVRGRQIVVDFSEQEVQTVTVLDQASGVYLEARPDSVAERPPPTGRRPRPGQQPPQRRPSPPAGINRP